jgi:uroporphyrinogen decarboxylase
MNGHERMKALLERKPTDIIPHFELVFQIPEQAFGLSWVTAKELLEATPKERETLKEKYFHIWDLIIETYGWDAVLIPYYMEGFPEGSLITQARDRYKNRAMVYTDNGNGTFWMPFGGNAMMDFSIRMFEDRGGLHEEAEIKLARSNELAKRQTDSGAEFICINSDYAFNDNPFISPQDFKELVTPYLTRNVEYMHSLGVKVILHSDGDLRKIFEQLVSTGIDGYQSIDPQGNMDIKEVKEMYGDKLILMGNVMASMLQDANEQKIRKSVKYCCEHGKPGGGYIFSTSNCLFAGMPLESYHIMLDEFRKYRVYSDK